MNGLPILSLFKRQPATGEAMWMFAGLGNPGREYERNRHNIGFMAVDAVREKFSLADFRKKFQGLISEGRIGRHRVLLLKPQTFMNLSGQSVGAAAKFYKIPPERIVVFHDEIDIGSGDVRVKKGGGNAGHNGLKSIQEHLGTADFWRVRLGIGRPGHQGDVSDHVLSDFSKEDESWKNELLERLATHCEVLMGGTPKDYEKKVTEKEER